MTLREAQEILDEEVAGLPERHRAVLALCCLENLTRDEAARRLGWSGGLVKSRLEEARGLLRRRLARRGMDVSVLLALPSLAQPVVTSADLATATPRAEALAAEALPAAKGASWLAALVAAGALAFAAIGVGLLVKQRTRWRTATALLAIAPGALGGIAYLAWVILKLL